MKNLIKATVALFTLIISTNTLFAQARESSISTEIKKQLNSNSLTDLYYPRTVKRFYEQQTFKPAWIKPQPGEGHAWQAMLMLDCVLQYGLSHADYHPKELTYTLLHDMLDTPDKTEIKTQAWFDIMLTDAIINFMNNLHYGKLNPYYSKQVIDNVGSPGFDASNTLMKALVGKDAMNVIATVQPLSKEYLDMLNHMVLLKGKYDGDCYEVPESTIRKLAINMERMRWANIVEPTYIHVNVPSYSLMFHQPDTTYLFKVIIGKPTTPTPTLLSNITHFTTSPEWRVPQQIFLKELLPKAIVDTTYFDRNRLIVFNKDGTITDINTQTLKQIKANPANYAAVQTSGNNALGSIAFRFANTYSVYIHDSPEQRLFRKKYRALSHGCIRVEQAEKLATLILKNDDNADKIFALHKNLSNRITQNFNLTKLLPLKITYLTCAVIDGEFIAYDDIYGLDNDLEKALYGSVSNVKP